MHNEVLYDCVEYGVLHEYPSWDIYRAPSTPKFDFLALIYVHN